MPLAEPSTGEWGWKVYHAWETHGEGFPETHEWAPPAAAPDYEQRRAAGGSMVETGDSGTAGAWFSFRSVEGPAYQPPMPADWGISGNDDG